MKHRRKRLLIVAVTVALFVPAAAFADIVFDPSNFAEAVLQVTDDVQLVEQFQQEVQNQLAMLHSWGYTQLAGIMQSMNVWQQVFGTQGATYTSADPGNTLDSQYPATSGDYSNVTDASIAAMRQSWDEEERQVLIENRTVQNETYLDLAPTAQRIGQYVEHSNSASGITAATQAGNEELATLVAQIQSLQAQEITDARAEVERKAQEQAEEAYGDQQCQAVRAGWDSPQQPATSLVDAFPGANQ
jgi:P-type conjugative transfer protein TrbJ